MPAEPRDVPVEILLVEDTEADAELMVEALKEGALRSNVTVVDNGDDALAYLRQEGAYANAPLPDLILLDLHLPRLSGNEVLHAVGQDERLRHIPYVVFTAEKDEATIRTAYDLSAVICVPKPMDLEEYEVAVRRIEQFWLGVARRA